MTILHILIVLFSIYELHKCGLAFTDIPNHKLALNKKCRNDSECSNDFASCSINNVCQCDFGYSVVLLSDLNLSCRKKVCKVDQECSELFGENIVCEKSNCVCPNGFIFIDGKCTTINPKIGSPCTQSQAAGPLAACSARGKITCRLGTRQQNIVACTHVRCLTNELCAKEFPYTECDPVSRMCKCNSHFHQDQGETLCLKGISRGGACKQDFNCGQQAICTGGTCKCPSGFRNSENDTANCVKITCDKNRECSSMDVNTYCTHKNGSEGSCVCKSNTILDPISQFCISDPDHKEHSIVPVILICALSILLLAIVILFIYANRKLIFAYFL